DPGERLVDVHRVQERLVVAVLELVSCDQESIRIFLDLVCDLAGGKSVERRLPDELAVVLVLTGEGNDRRVRAPTLREIGADGVEVLDGPLDAPGHNHRPGLAPDLLE